jgi:hypothetical protein
MNMACVETAAERRSLISLRPLVWLKRLLAAAYAAYNVDDLPDYMLIDIGLADGRRTAKALERTALPPLAAVFDAARAPETPPRRGHATSDFSG